MIEYEGEDEDPKPNNLAAFLPFACRKLGMPFTVRVHVRTQEEYVSRLDTARRHARRGASRLHSEKLEESSSAADGSAYWDPGEIVLAVLQDAAGRVVQLRLERAHTVPAALLRIMALCVPYQPHLAALALRRARLRAHALAELATLLQQARLTELCLDDARLAPHQLDELLADGSRLTLLSLARCELGDAASAALCARLVHPLPAAFTLRALHLGSNRISDEAAPAFADMLRSNRTLRYLNLSGNLLTDVGARKIFGSLREFPLTQEEIMTKRSRMLAYLKTRRDVYEKCMQDLLSEKSSSELSSRGKLPPRKASPRVRRASALSMMDALAARAQAMTDELVGEFEDPFSSRETRVRDRVTYSIGNTALCCLSLAYNNLEAGSVAELRRVLGYQRWLVERAGPGLLRAALSGNALPAACADYDLINDLLDRLYRAAEQAAIRAKRIERSRTKPRH